MTFFERRLTPQGEAWWVKLDKPSDMSGKYELTMKFPDAVIRPLATEMANYLAQHCAAQGIKKTEPITKPWKDADGNVVQGFQSMTFRNTEKVVAVDTKNHRVDPKIIGNGSKVVVSFAPMTWTYKGRAGCGAWMDGVIVLTVESAKREMPTSLEEMGAATLAGKGEFDAETHQPEAEEGPLAEEIAKLMDGGQEEVPF